MSVSYTAVGLHQDETDTGYENTETDELLDERTPASVRIESYIPAKKRTALFDIGILLAVLVVFGVVMGVLLYYYILPNMASSTKLAPTHNSEWINTYPRYGSESVVRLIDVNGDGADDVIFGVAQPSDIEIFTSQSQYCQQYDKRCQGLVIAVDGKTGKEIWNISTYSEIFELNCGNIDIDKDDQPDCLGAGRKGSFIAFDPRMGALLWEPQTGSESYIKYEWNIYNPLVVNDTNNDGVNEVILAHGGDPEFAPENKTRFPGRLILLDGSRGHLIGRYINMPDRLETYNSPVLHTDKQGVEYVLIGTGGESVPGSLFIVRLEDLVKNFLSSASDHGDARGIQRLKHVNNGFFRIHESRSKGVMVPVVLADVNSDNYEDIIVSSFDGVIAAYDGDTFEKIWKFENGQAESYTTPGVGYFNDDGYLDFMMHWNYGLWPDYNKSEIVVHSGIDGSALWKFETTKFSMTSDLVIRTNTPHQDMFVFRVQGRSGTPLDSGVGVMHGIDPQIDKIRKSKLKHQSTLSCELPGYDLLASEVFIVDWETRNSPKRVFRRDVDKYYYDAKMESANIHKRGYRRNTALDETSNPGQHKNPDCVIMKQSSRTTGAVGDINGDDKLDIVLTFNAMGDIKDGHLDYIRTEVSLDLVAIQLEIEYGQYPSLMPDKTLKMSDKGSEISRLARWKSKANQIWTGYMGRDSLSRYKAREGS